MPKLARCRCLFCRHCHLDYQSPHFLSLSKVQNDSVDKEGAGSDEDEEDDEDEDSREAKKAKKEE